jgi:hypothetical protein
MSKAKGKIEVLPAVRKPMEVGKLASITRVELSGGTVMAEDALASLPAEFRDGEQIAGFPPQPSWTEKGQAIWGTFLNLREAVGPNSSRIYEIAADAGKGKEPVLVGVWGTTVLDRQMDEAFAKGLSSGDKLAIVYLGTTPSKKAGQADAHLFALKVVIRKQAAKTV